MFNWLNLGVGALLGATLSAVPVYLYGKHDGERVAAVVAMERSIEVLRTRGVINNEITSADADELCRHYGLQPDSETECVRRLRQTDTDD